MVEVVSLDAAEDPWVSTLGLKVHAAGDGARGYGYSPRFVPWLKKNSSNFDSVVVNGVWNYASFGTWRALSGSTTPYFVFPHGMLDPWFKRTYPLKHLKKWMYWPWAEYRVLRDANAVLYTCEEERLLARESFWLYRCRERVTTFGSADPAGSPEVQREVFLNAYPDLRHKRLILFLGRLHKKKGCDLLIKAFASVCDRDPTLHLVMAGPDQTGWQKQLEQLANNLGISKRITWTGMLSGDYKWGAMRTADAFILPSHQENFGISIIEAMACRTPVLITRPVNIWREIEQDGAGLVNADTVSGVTQLLSEWLDKSDTERASFKTNARLSFERRFEIRKAALTLAEILADSLKVPTASPNQSVSEPAHV